MTFLKTYEIDPSVSVQEVINRDYRTVEVFRKHGIEYCCGGRWSLETAAMMKGLELPELISELQQASRIIHLPGSLPFDKWDISFLADYIVHVHHYYLKKALPEIREILGEFVNSHSEKYPQLVELEKTFTQIYKETLPHLQEEEEIIFPYIRQIAHAFENRESYAGLLVRTLRKPVERVMDHEHRMMEKMLKTMRQLTQNYSAPEDACTSHKVTFSKLKELDNDLVQHLYLEQGILFPKALEIEKVLLDRRE
jgi:regulator of cell morphogenesis and NO signaling